MDETASKWYNRFAKEKERISTVTSIIVVVAVLLFGSYMISSLLRFHQWEKLQKLKLNNEHFKIVMTSDRNCNDCHLGVSFLNLLTNEDVRNNDNVVLYIMDKVHIKRW